MRWLVMALVVVLLLALALPVVAGPNREVFNNVEIGGELYEITASTRGGGNPYTACRYFGDDFATYEGRYDSPEFAPDLLAFCVDNFEARVVE